MLIKNFELKEKNLNFLNMAVLHQPTSCFALKDYAFFPSSGGREAERASSPWRVPLSSHLVA